MKKVTKYILPFTFTLTALFQIFSLKYASMYAPNLGGMNFTIMQVSLFVFALFQIILHSYLNLKERKGLKFLYNKIHLAFGYLFINISLLVTGNIKSLLVIVSFILILIFFLNEENNV